MKKLKVFSDGCSKGNPGQAGIGYLIFDEHGHLVFKASKPIGIKTNNEAEYIAAIEALKEVSKLGAVEVELFSDSELLVKQLNGEYTVRSNRLKPLYRKLIKLSQSFRKFEVKHVKREANQEADRLAKLTISRSRA